MVVDLLYIKSIFYSHKRAHPAQSIKYVGSNTATSYFLYETTFAVNPLILCSDYYDEEEEQQPWRFEH